MRRLTTAALVLISLVASARPAAAQTPGSVAIAFGATTFREDPPGDVFPAVTYDTGWAIHGSYVFLWNGRIGPAVDFGANRRDNIVGERQTLDAWLVGARVELTRSRWLTTFAHGLVGRETFEEPGFKETGLAIQPGAGADVILWKGLAVRAQVDHRIVKYPGDDGRYRDWRMFVGGVVKMTLQ
jgi:hypothetical protein